MPAHRPQPSRPSVDEQPRWEGRLVDRLVPDPAPDPDPAPAPAASPDPGPPPAPARDETAGRGRGGRGATVAARRADPADDPTAELVVRPVRRLPAPRAPRPAPPPAAPPSPPVTSAPAAPSSPSTPSAPVSSPAPAEPPPPAASPAAPAAPAERPSPELIPQRLRAASAATRPRAPGAGSGPSRSRWRLRERLAVLLGLDAGAAALAETAPLLQLPVTTGRRVVVLSTGAPATSLPVAAALARELGAARHDGVAALARAGDDGALGRLLGATRTSRAAAVLAAADPDAAAAAMSPTPVPGLRVLTGGEADPSSAAELADRLGRRHAVTVLDAGAEPAHPALGRAHAVVLVSGPGSPGDAPAPPGVPAERVVRVRLAAEGERRPRAADTSLVLPADPALAADGPGPGGMRERTRVAVWSLAAQVVARAVAS